MKYYYYTYEYGCPSHLNKKSWGIQSTYDDQFSVSDCLESIRKEKGLTSKHFIYLYDWKVITAEQFNQLKEEAHHGKDG